MHGVHPGHLGDRLLNRDGPNRIDIEPGADTVAARSLHHHLAQRLIRRDPHRAGDHGGYRLR